MQLMSFWFFKKLHYILDTYLNNLRLIRVKFDRIFKDDLQLKQRI